jgi:hypothetical protein
MRMTLLMLALVTGLSAAQAPVVQNGQIETRRGTIASAIAAASQTDATWLAWRVPMVAGDRELCSTWVNDRERFRGAVLDAPRTSVNRPPQQTPAPTVNLSAGTNLIILLRVVEGRLERLRTVADDCPIDANGQTLRWLSDVTAAESLAYLESAATQGGIWPSPQNIHDSAISAIALHRDAAADPALDRLTAPTQQSAVRTTAARWLANTRGEHGFDRVSALIRDERDVRTRTTFVSALARSPSARTPAALLALARTETEPNVRSEAALGYARTGATGAVETLLALLGKESYPDTRSRIVAALEQVPGQAGVPALLNLARTDADARVKKEAVRALSRSTDPRATAYLEDVLKQ